jgi:hypothetical protein
MIDIAVFLEPTLYTTDILCINIMYSYISAKMAFPMLVFYYINRLINSHQVLTKSMRCRSALIFAFVLIISMTNIPSVENASFNESVHIAVPSQGMISIDRNWTLNIIVLNYNESKVNETILLDGLPLYRVQDSFC